MTTKIGGIRIAGFLGLTEDTDTYATHVDNYGKGGIHSVQNIIERDLISFERRTEGMLCYIIDDGAVYELYGGIENINWILVYSITNDRIVINMGLAKDYIFVGDINGNPSESPILMDMRLDLIRIKSASVILSYPNEKFLNSQVLSELGTGFMLNTDGIINIKTGIDPADLNLIEGYVFVGDSNNKAIGQQRITLDNLPSFKVDLLNPEGLLNNYGIYNLYTGQGISVLSNPLNVSNPTTTLRVDMSNMPNLSIGKFWIGTRNYTPPVITIDSVPPFLHVIGSLNWDPRGVLPILGDSYGVPNEIGLDPGQIFIGSKTIGESGQITTTGLNPGKIFIGSTDILEAGQITTTGLNPGEIFIGNKDIGKAGQVTSMGLQPGRIFIGSSDIGENGQVTVTGLNPGKMFIGSDTPGEIGQIIKIGLNPGKLFIGSRIFGEEGQITSTGLAPGEMFIGSDNIDELGQITKTGLQPGRIFIGSKLPTQLGQIVTTLTIDEENLPNLTVNKYWKGDITNRPVEVDINFSPNDATYVIRTANEDLLNSQVLSFLGTGITKLTLDGHFAIAIPDDDYVTKPTLEALRDETKLYRDEAKLSSEEAAVSAQEAAVSAEEATTAATEASSAATEATTAATEATTAATEASASAIESTAAAAESTAAAAESTTAATVSTAAAAESTLAAAESTLAAAESTLAAAESTAAAAESTAAAVESTAAAAESTAAAGVASVAAVAAGASALTAAGSAAAAALSAIGAGVSENKAQNYYENLISVGLSFFEVNEDIDMAHNNSNKSYKIINLADGEDPQDAVNKQQLDFVAANAGTVTYVGLTGSTGLTVGGSPITSSGNITLDLSQNLQNISSISTQGFTIRKSDGSFVTGQIATNNGLTITNGDGTLGTPTIGITNSITSGTSIYPTSISYSSQGLITSIIPGVEPVISVIGTTRQIRVVTL
jgi:hypothetical protein